MNIGYRTLVARRVAGLGFAACLFGCNVVLGVSAAAVLGGAGYVAGQCYDQVSVLVRDEAGQQLCDARVSVEREGSAHTLRPCYHASLTSGSWHFTAEQSGYELATADLTVAERKGPCPHYTHTLELSLRRIGAPKEAPFGKLKVPPPSPPPPPPPRVRPALPLGPAFPPVSGANTSPPAPSAQPEIPTPPASPPTAPATPAPAPPLAPVPPTPAPVSPAPAPAPPVPAPPP